MSGLQKVEKIFLSTLDDITSQFEDVYSKELSSTFNGLDVELKGVPPGNGYNYFRCIKGKIAGVHFWLSNPEYERPQPLCEFQVTGQDQFGRGFNERVSERMILTQIPWQNFVPPKEFMIVPEDPSHGGDST
jgi:hypothetical protein